MKRFLFSTALILITFSTLFSENADSLKMFSPKIEGTIRAKYEYNTNLDAHRFQVRNARFSINGNFSPTVSYKAEMDLSDEGVTKMLDAYVRMKPTKWFSFTLGQQKVPFSTDNIRSPHQLYFANRSFIGKQLTGLRDVGATFAFINKSKIPFELSMGWYNGDGLYNQQNWKTDDISFASRLELFPAKNIELSLNYNSVKPENIRMNLYDVGCYANFGNIHIESEYFYKTYPNNLFQATKGFFVFGGYDININKPNLKKITTLVRYDMMSANNKGYAEEDGTYTADHLARSRVTSGITFSLNKPFLNDIRLNYEKYFYANGITDTDDKIVVEFVVRF